MQKLLHFRGRAKFLLICFTPVLLAACAEDVFPDVFREQNEAIVWVSTVSDSLRSDTLSRVSFRYAVTRDNFCLSRARWDTLFKTTDTDSFVLQFVGQYPFVAECEVTEVPDTVVFTLPSKDSGSYSFRFIGMSDDTLGWDFHLTEP